MTKLTRQLKERFGMDGNGKLEEVEWLGREGKEITVEEFEVWSGAKLENGQSNEHGTEDFKITLIDEKSDDFEMTLEVKNGIITHCYY